MQVAPINITAAIPGAPQPSAGAAGLAEMAGAAPIGTEGLLAGSGAEGATIEVVSTDGSAFAQALAATMAAGLQPAAQPQAVPAASGEVPAAGRAKTAPPAPLTFMPPPQTPATSAPEVDASLPEPMDEAVSADIAAQAEAAVQAFAVETKSAKSSKAPAAKTDVASPVAQTAEPAVATADIDVPVALASATSTKPPEPEAKAAATVAPSPALMPPPPAPLAAARPEQPTAKTDGKRRAEAGTTPTAVGQTPGPAAAKAAATVFGANDAIAALDGNTAGAEGDAAGADTQAPLDAADAPRAAEAPLTAAPGAAPTAGYAARADHTTVPHLVTQMVQKADAKITRFDLQLTPEGLGKVDVKVEISASGALTAALSFDNPQAAAELRGRADELRNALQQAGFDLSETSLNFDFNGERQQRRAQAEEDVSGVLAGRAFAVANDAADNLLATVAEAAARYRRGGATSGLDIRI